MASSGPDNMLPWLGAAARDARRQHNRLQVHIAATLGVSQETIGQFERGQRWPRDPDATLAAYADDLDIDAKDIWVAALQRWEASRGAT